MSEIKVDSIGPRVDSGTLTIGAAGDTVNIAGTAGTGFPAGVSLSGSTNNTVATVTGANALAGEANLTFDGSTFTATGTSSLDGAVVINESGASVDFRVESDDETHMLTVSGANNVVGISESGFFGDLGVGLHIKTNDSGGTVDGGANELVLENGSDTGLTILGGTSGSGKIAFGDSGDNDIGYIKYDHSNNMMTLSVNADGGTLKMSSDGNLQLGTTTNSGRVSFVSSGNEKIGFFDALNSGSYSQSVAYFRCARNTQNGSYLILEGSHGGGSCFFVADSGNVTNANNSYGQSSDERIKKNITNANSQWDDIKAVKVKNFRYKSNDSITQLGVVAQDLETSGMNGLIHDSLPTIQDIEADSTFGTLYTEQDKIDENIPEDKEVGDVKEVKEKVKSVKYSVLYMKAIKALQESMERIEQLEAKVTTLENA